MTIEIDAERILVFRYRDGVFIDEPTAREIVTLATALATGDTPLATIVLVSRIRGINKRARDYFASSAENKALSSRVALVINSPIARITANFFMGLNKTQQPTRLFNDEASARAWIRESRQAD
ncbi:MAG: hypothetical protein KC468_11365 [Myxococcales bacterium]|nr:hypothetical protein [Myxococcales bacterium]